MNKNLANALARKITPVGPFDVAVVRVPNGQGWMIEVVSRTSGESRTVRSVDDFDRLFRPLSAQYQAADRAAV